jgi:hypothetical protein
VKTFVAAALVSLRAGFYCIVRLNLTAAVVGTLAALAWNPDATADDIVVVVALPVILVYVGSRILSALMSGRSPASRATQGPEPAKVVQASAPRPVTRAQRFWIRVGVNSIELFLVALGTILAIPFYAGLKIYWAIPFALVAAGCLLAGAIFALMLVMWTQVPAFRNSIINVARVALHQILPQRSVRSGHSTT